MAEAGVALDGEDTIVVTIRLPLAAFESAGLSPSPTAAPAAAQPSPGAAAAAASAPAAEPEQADEPGAGPFGASGERDTSPPSEGNNPRPDGLVEQPAKKSSGRSRARKPAARKSRSRSTAKK